MLEMRGVQTLPKYFEILRLFYLLLLICLVTTNQFKNPVTQKLVVLQIGTRHFLLKQ